MLALTMLVLSLEIWAAVLLPLHPAVLVLLAVPMAGLYILSGIDRKTGRSSVVSHVMSVDQAFLCRLGKSGYFFFLLSVALGQIALFLYFVQSTASSPQDLVAVMVPAIEAVPVVSGPLIVETTSNSWPVWKMALCGVGVVVGMVAVGCLGWHFIGGIGGFMGGTPDVVVTSKDIVTPIFWDMANNAVDISVLDMFMGGVKVPAPSPSTALMEPAALASQTACEVISSVGEAMPGHPVTCVAVVTLSAVCGAVASVMGGASLHPFAASIKPLDLSRGTVTGVVDDKPASDSVGSLALRLAGMSSMHLSYYHAALFLSESAAAQEFALSNEQEFQQQRLAAPNIGMIDEMTLKMEDLYLKGYLYDH